MQEFYFITEAREWPVEASSLSEAIRLAFEHKQAETPFLVLCEGSLLAAYRKFWGGWCQIQANGKVLFDSRRGARQLHQR